MPDFAGFGRTTLNPKKLVRFENGLQTMFNTTSHLSVLRIRIRWIRKILASWIRIRKNMRIQGVKYQPKTAKKECFLLLKPKSKFLKKERL